MVVPFFTVIIGNLTQKYVLADRMFLIFHEINSLFLISYRSKIGIISSKFPKQFQGNFFFTVIDNSYDSTLAD